MSKWSAVAYHTPPPVIFDTPWALPRVAHERPRAAQSGPRAPWAPAKSASGGVLSALKESQSDSGAAKDVARVPEEWPRALQERPRLAQERSGSGLGAI